MDNIDLIPKKPKEEPFWQELLFYVSFLSLAVALLFCIGFGVLAKRSSLELEKINQELAKEKTQEQIETETQVLDYEKKVIAFANLLKKRKPLSKIFDFLESEVHPGVYFTKAGFTTDSDIFQISGLADSFQILGQQALIFKENLLIKDINLKQVGIGKYGGVEFSFEVFFNKEVFEEKKEAKAEELLPEETSDPEISPEITSEVIPEE
ncbi:hypothetical protein L6250_02500 [Candidatus Parcubacteria bacterium]|nr:hypothetical protein [Patescibacteria group bacterium]MBU4466921.1 hypothetical protein [Patescibacteria group bacterium]MCG2688482.1 hypothetical protein [Candidatus Parcubacteria bacterium]